MTEAVPHPLDRREVLAALAAVAGLTVLPPGAQASETNLLGMTHPLCGLNPINPDTAHAFYDALTEELGEDTLASLARVVRENPGDGLTAALTAAGLDDATNRVIEVFYTGIVTRDGKQTTLHYLDTLQWAAMVDSTKAPSRCGQDFGFWNRAPDLGEDES